MKQRAGFPRIEVRNLQRAISVNRKALEEFAGKALRLCLDLRKGEQTELTKLREIFVLIVSDRRMALLHRQFRGQTGATDVLTFSHGEIFVGADTARRQARQFGNSLAHEMQLYIVHGLLHLHGFDDRDEPDARLMEETQERIMERATGLN